jgi:hypothetical protein
MALSKATKLFLVASIHYNYNLVANLVIDFQISSNEGINNHLAVVR